jgi:hypothetical protein
VRHCGTLAQPSVALSGRGRGDHVADAALGVGREQRPDVLAHPRPADLARHAVSVARLRELEDQDEVRLVDLRDASGECARIDREPHPLLQRLDGGVGDRSAKTEVVDDDVHGADPILAGTVLLLERRDRRDRGAVFSTRVHAAVPAHAAAIELLPGRMLPAIGRIVGVATPLALGDLPCVLHGDTDRVAVVFPGASTHEHRLGGTPARPDLHYARAVLQKHGYSVLEVWWDASSRPAENRDAWYDANVATALSSLNEAPAFLVGRSLGTYALARRIVAEGDTFDRPTIWIAPLMNQPIVRDALKRLEAPAFVVGGTADEAFLPAELEMSRATILALDGANHGLEVDDPRGSARLLVELVDGLDQFVGTVADGR